VSRVAKVLQLVPEDPARQHALATEATAAQQAAVEAAFTAEARATARYDETGQEGDQVEAAKAHLARERAERLLEARQGEEAAALSAVQAAGRAALNRELDTALKFLAAVEYSEELEQVVKLDRQLAKIVDVVADRVVAAKELAAKAVALGEQVGRAPEVQIAARVASLPWIRMLARVAVARARAAEHRDPLDGWVDAEPEPRWGDINRGVYDVAVAEVQRMQQKGSR